MHLLSLSTLCLWSFVFLLRSESQAQHHYYYPLQSNFNEATGSASPLVPLSNGSGQTGNFVSVGLPISTCSGLGVLDGYEYADNAGLRFAVPPATISCEYSILFTWRYDNPGGNQEWLRLLSFIYSDDSGIDLWTQFPSVNGTLYYWDLDPLLVFPGFCLAQPTYGPLSPPNYFNEVDYYRLALTRTCNDVMQVYVNGTYQGGFTDTDQKYMPQAPDHQIVFFRDTFDTSCYPTAFPGEAAPGFIKDLVITDNALTSAEIQADFDTLCPVLLALQWQQFEGLAQARGNLLQGRVEHADQVDHYTVERSTNGQEFVPIAQIQGDPGLPFSYLDQDPSGPRQFYRVNAMMGNGQAVLSPVQELKSQLRFQCYPNPVQTELFIQVPFAYAGQALVIQSPFGVVVHKERLAGGVQVISVADLPEGLWLVRLGNLPAQSILKID